MSISVLKKQTKKTTKLCCAHKTNVNRILQDNYALENEAIGFQIENRIILKGQATRSHTCTISSSSTKTLKHQCGPPPTPFSKKKKTTFKTGYADCG